MGKIYRVLVIEQDDNNSRPGWDTAMPQQRTLFEAAGPAERLIGYASDEVYAALRAVAAEAEAERFPARVVGPLIDRETDGSIVGPEGLQPEQTFDGAGPDAAPRDEQPVDAPAPAPKTRKRRTKAEIDADKAKEAAAAQPAETPASPPAEVAEPVPAEPAPAPEAAAVPVPAPAPPVVVPPADGQPWNPFLASK